MLSFKWQELWALLEVVPGSRVPLPESSSQPCYQPALRGARTPFINLSSVLPLCAPVPSVKCKPATLTSSCNCEDTWQSCTSRNLKVPAFFTAKETINKTKRQPTEWEKILANDLTDKELTSKIHKKLIQLSLSLSLSLYIYIYTPIKNGQKAWIDIFQLANRYMKRCATLLITKEMQIKATVRYHLTPVRMTSIKKSINNKCWWGCGEKGTLIYCWWECKLVRPLWRTVWRVFKKLKTELQIQQFYS